MTDDPNTGSFWRTLPGIITAVAGLATAVAGLLVALSQTGLLGGGRAPAGRAHAEETHAAGAPVQPATALARSSPAAEGGPGGTATRARAVQAAPGAEAVRTLPVGGREVRVGDAVFRILSAVVDRPGPGELELRLVVRATNNHPSSFLPVSASTFRLRVDSVPQAPVDAFTTYVPPGSAEQGTVTFIVPEGTRAADLVFRHETEGGERATPLDLTGAPTAR